MADNQDPLAALQQLLEDQKKQTSNPSSGSQVVKNLDLDVDDPQLAADQIPAEEKAPAGPTAEEIALLQKSKEEEDRVKIAEQLAKMQTELKDTPQYQARASQKEANEAEDQKKRLEERSKRIFQLKHLDPS